MKGNVGALVLSLVLMEWVCGNLLVVAGFLSLVTSRVGSIVKFWQDVWCGDTSLGNYYPELFTVSRNKEAYVADLMKSPNGVLFRDLKPFKTGNWSLYPLLWMVIYGVSLRGVGKDKIC